MVHHQGNTLYGTTVSGGAYGSGTVFDVTTAGTEEVLYSFTGGADGAYPYAALFLKGSNLYGTTTEGGAYGYGTVFNLALAGTYTVLHSFAGSPDGSSPVGSGVVLDKQGNLYGTTQWGGAYNNGTVFDITKSGTEKMLYSFTGGTDGAEPMAGLVLDATNNNLYGTTSRAGGTIFLITLPDFTITASPTSATVSPGQSTSSTLTLSPVAGFSGGVKLSCTVPGGYGLSCGVSPRSVKLSNGASATANLSIGTSPSTPAGVYKIQAKGVSGTLVHSTTFTLTVQ